MRRRLGQHFLTDQGIIQRILGTAEITAEDCVVEIGPGKGSLTSSLARQAKHVIAVEYDAELGCRLRQLFAGQPQIHILQADARDLNYPEILSAYATPAARVKIIANLPYYAAIPILFTIFRYFYVFREGTLMFQQEVAERITASPGTKAYGTVSLATQYYSQPEYCFSVSAQAFHPRPKVESAVVKLSFLTQPRVAVSDPAYLFQVIKYAFQSRRKTLKNALSKNCAAQFPLALLNQACEQLQFPEHVRGEDLTLEDFAHLSNLLIRLQTTPSVPACPS